jgi:hypothetical protein
MVRLMDELKLIEPDHIYTVDNRPLISVTQTIQTNFGKRQHYSEWHAGKGKAVHLAIHFLVTNQLKWDSVDPVILGRVKAFQKFHNEVGLQVVESELQMYSKRLQFAGTLDLMFEDKYLILGDIKSHIEPVLELQLGAYSFLYEERYKRKIKKAVGIQLKDDGNYNLKWYKDVTKIQRIFLANLTMANWRKQNYPKGE